MSRMIDKGTKKNHKLNVNHCIHGFTIEGEQCPDCAEFMQTYAGYLKVEPEFMSNDLDMKELLYVVAEWDIN